MLTPAQAYERYLVPRVFLPWTRHILRRAPDLTGKRVLDVCTGTGIVARQIAPVADQVTALDIDSAMLAIARAQPDAGCVRWVEGNALSLPFADASFDFAISLEGTQFLPDLAAGLAEIRRVLVPGGMLITSNWGSWEGNPAFLAMADGLREFVSADAARLPAFRLDDPEVIARAARAAGFASVRVEPDQLRLPIPSARDFVAWVAAGAPTTRRNLAQLSEARREDFLRFVEARLAPHLISDGTLLLPSMRHILTASA